MAETTVTFHEAYADIIRGAGLPPSQLREAHKRLSKCKNPLTDEEIAGEHPRVQACLERIAAAYGRKKERSKIASKARRDAARQKRVATADLDVPAAPAEPSDPVETEIVTTTLEACTIECEISDGEISNAEPEPTAPLACQPEPEPSPPPPMMPLKRETTEAIATPSPSAPADTRINISRRLVRSSGGGSAKKVGCSLVSRR